MLTLVTAPEMESTSRTATPEPVKRWRRASYGYSGRGADKANTLALLKLAEPTVPATDGLTSGAMFRTWTCFCCSGDVGFSSGTSDGIAGGGNASGVSSGAGGGCAGSGSITITGTSPGPNGTSSAG